VSAGDPGGVAAAGNATAKTARGAAWEWGSFTSWLLALGGIALILAAR
jgi:hypothetical protein